ncbi:MAG: glycosyltransferase A (GT-A) superfamily protein (DUF2064 family) [Cyclobacteriaceae bacterium]
MKFIEKVKTTTFCLTKPSRIREKTNLHLLSKLTAILIFSRTAFQEAKRKAIVRNEHQNHALQKLLLKKTINIAKSSGLPFYLIDESQQSGKDFGTRFNNAYSKIFSYGYDNVIAIGSDCPDLTSADIRNAAHHIAVPHQELVIGPDLKGGVYLLALAKSFFQKTDFNEISWNAKTLRDSILSYTSGGAKLLATKSDINDSADFARLVRRSVFLRAIWRLILSFLNSPKRLAFYLSDFVNHTSTLRGPPVLI